MKKDKPHLSLPPAPETPATAMVVDDTPANLDLLTRILDDAGYRVNAFADGQLALRSARRFPPDLILLDILMPGLDGYEVCARLKADQRTRRIPVIFISALNQTDDILRAFEVGGVDYVNKPFREAEVLARVNAHLDLYRTQRQLRASREHVRALLDSTAESIFGLDRDGRCTFVNQACLDLLGLESAKQAIGENMHTLIQHRHKGEPIAPEACPLLHAWNPDEPYHSEDETFVTRAGRRFSAECWSYPLTDDGQTVGRVVTLVDISERKSMQEMLLQSATVFRTTNEAVAIADAHQRIIQVNRAFTQITGFSQDDLNDSSLSLIYSARNQQELAETVTRGVAERGGWQGEIWSRRKSGEAFPAWMSINQVCNEKGEVSNFVAVFADISHLKRTQQKLAHLAHHDPLTGLPNRLLFGARLEHAVARAEREQGGLAVFFLDLDQFKLVNDSLGHLAGDELLLQVARRLKGVIREEDTLARLGGDEFTLVQEDVRAPRDASRLAEKLLRTFDAPFQVAGEELHVGGSIGISLFPDDARDPEGLLRNADNAMYNAKRAGRNRFHFYTGDLTDRALDRIRLESELHNALRDGELTLHYQPQTCLHTGRTLGLEALVRWNHPSAGLLGPDRFIPLAEECGLIIPLGLQVLRMACEQGRRWLDEGVPFGTLAVNVSAGQLHKEDFFEQVRAVIAETGMPPERLELELTESAVMEDPQRAKPLLEALRSLGIGVAVDDFGTGYSSLAYLKNLPLTKLKIDKAFVTDLPADEDDAAIVRAIVALGKTLGYALIAEGVEAEAQRTLLRQLGCDIAQGFLISRPVDADTISRWLAHAAGEPPPPGALIPESKTQPQPETAS